MNADVIIIGAGPGGLAAAESAAINGASVILIEREHKLGGILNQCIHDGFGLLKYSQSLTGPEYAAKAVASLEDDKIKGNITILTDTIVTSIDDYSEKFPSEKLTNGCDNTESDISYQYHINVVSQSGVSGINGKSIVLATGCRERTRGIIGIPGTRPAGVYTAGVAQNLINTKNIMIGSKVVILGTGDIGLIMARRLILEGANVLCAIEINDDACGLSRNVRQCLQDYNIPIYLSHTVTNIIGRDRVEAIQMAQVDKQGKPMPGTEKIIECDTLILSVGLIPENEIAQTIDVKLAGKSNELLTDKFLMTNKSGIFACGNCKGIMDLVDYVSKEGYGAGRNAAAYALGNPMRSSSVKGVNPAPKGMPEYGKLTCICCPMGCSLTIDEDDNVSGNMCGNGEKYAINERYSPTRILTTTVKTQCGDRDLLPVRSDKGVELREMQELVKRISQISVTAPIKIGDIIMEDVGDNKVNIVAQCDIPFDKSE